MSSAHMQTQALTHTKNTHVINAASFGWLQCLKSLPEKQAQPSSSTEQSKKGLGQSEDTQLLIGGIF